MRALLFAVAFAATLQGIGSATAQNWPTRPVTMVVPFAAGGTADVAARILGGRLSEILRQSVVIENIGGAGGMIGVARVAKAPPAAHQASTSLRLKRRALRLNKTLFGATNSASTVFAAHSRSKAAVRRILAGCVVGTHNGSPSKEARRHHWYARRQP